MLVPQSNRKAKITRSSRGKTADLRDSSYKEELQAIMTQSIGKLVE